MRFGSGVALLLVAAASMPLAAQAPTAATPASAQAPPSGAAATASAPQPIQTFSTESSRVLLDVIVRDGHDNPVTDLKSSDFEIYEDGVRQPVDMFEVVRSAEPTAAPESGVPPPRPEAAPSRPRPRQEMNLIAMVFDRLSPEARNLAKQSALTYLEGDHPATDRVGVFLIDLSLITLQGFTSDADKIRAAIVQAGDRATSSYASNRGRQRDLQSGLDIAGSPSPAGSGAAAGAAAGAAGAEAGAAAVTAQFQDMQLRMARNFESLERDQQGYSTSNGLLAVVNALRWLPGRKSVVFFSEGLSIPSNVQAHFSAVISEANRANVSIYAMDSAGLRSESVMSETRREMIAQAQEQMRQRSSGRDYTGGAMSKQLERNEDLLRLNPHSGLGQLTNDTGGFLVRDTNDLKTGFRRIDADMRFYYMLGYEPTNQDYDGRFRKVEVKVKRAGTKVRARKGYFALRGSEERPLLPFEAPAVALLDRGSTANAFPSRVRGLSFPEPSRPGLAPILVEVPGNTLTFTADKQQKTYAAEFAIVARIKDQSGRVVDRLSQGYRMTGPLDKKDAARAGEVLFYREAELAPGRYTVESIAYDAEADAASVRRSELVVPEPAAGRLRLSSLSVVKRAEQVPAAERDPKNPLTFGDFVVYPSLGEPVKKATRKELAFYFNVYSARPGALAPKARITVLRGGAKVAEAPTTLPQPDADGRIQHVLGLPLGQFQPGSYELRVAVEDDRGQDTGSVAFTVEE